MTTWPKRVRELARKLGRTPTVDELLAETKKHKLTPEEYKAQGESWARANLSTGDKRFD